LGSRGIALGYDGSQSEPRTYKAGSSRVFNDRGSFEGKAELSTDVQEGLAAANLGYWPSLTRSGSAVNATTSSLHCNLGGAGHASTHQQAANKHAVDAKAVYPFPHAQHLAKQPRTSIAALKQVG
jgi:hypothetical protein